LKFKIPDIRKMIDGINRDVERSRGDPKIRYFDGKAGILIDSSTLSRVTSGMSGTPPTPYDEES